MENKSSNTELDDENILDDIQNPSKDVEMKPPKEDFEALNEDAGMDPFENYVVTPKKLNDKSSENGIPQKKATLDSNSPVKSVKVTPKSGERELKSTSIGYPDSPSKSSSNSVPTLPSKSNSLTENNQKSPSNPRKVESPQKSQAGTMGKPKNLEWNHIFEKEALKYETQISDLFKQISSLSAQLDEQKTKNASIVKERDEKEAIIQEKLKVIRDQSQQKNKAVQETLDHDKQNLEFVLNAKQQECFQLSEELEYKKKQLQEKKIESRKDKELLAQTQANELELKSLLANANQQAQQSKKIVDWLNQELASKGDQLQQYRKEKTEQVASLQAGLDTANQENSSLQIRNQSLLERNNELQEKLETKLNQIRELENNQITIESQFKIEMNSQKKLADLYQSKCQELASQNQELEDVLRKVEEQLNKLNNESESRLMEKNEIIEEMQLEKNKLHLDIEKLESELQTINNELSAKSTAEQVGQFSQTAAVASRMQKTGKSFTQIYAEYTSLQQELIKEKSEVSRLNECLNHIVSEFEQRAPLIDKTNKDFHKAKQQNEQLAKSLSEVAHQNEGYKGELKRLRAELEAKETEHQLYEKNLMDCGRQIQALLREQASLKGQFQDNSPIAIPLEETEADSIISNHLVIFKNIQELQTQNQKLLRSIRSLSAKLDQQESVTLREAEESKIQALNESAVVIEKLQEELKRQQLNSESYSRERDQWRRIAETRRGSPNRSANQSPEPGTEQPLSVTNSADYESYYRELQREFDVYRKECGTDTRLLKTQMEQTQNEKMELSIQVAKLNNQISYLNDRHEMLLGNLNSKEKEFVQLKERFSALNTMSTRQDLKIEELSNTLSTTRQSLDTVAFENQNLKLEKQVWKQSESRMSKDVQDLIKERNLTNDRNREIQSLLEEKDHAHLQNVKKFESQIEQLGRELQLSRKQLNDLLDDQRSLTSKRDAEMREYQLKTEKLTSSYERTKGELSVVQTKEASAATRVTELTIRLEQAESKARIYEEKILNTNELGPEATEVDQIRSLESELAKARIEVEKLKAELVLVTEQAETFKQISQASEERLDEMNSTFDVYKAEMEQNICDMTSTTKHLEQERDDLIEKLKKLGETLTSTQEAMDLEQTERKNTLALYEKQIASLKEREKMAIINVNDMKADVERQVKFAKDAQENYEREIVAHSGTIQSLSQMKQNILILSQEKEEAAAQSNVAKDNLAHLTNTFNSTREKMQKDIEELESRVSDLNNQNNLLHAQFEQLTSSRTAQLVEGEEVQGNLAELNEVVKYLRREKEIVDTKLQIARQDAERSRLQIEHLQRSLDESNLVLADERKRGQENMGSERKHLELMEKIEQSNLLRESNITLRAQLEASGKKLEGEVEVRKAEITTLNEDNARWKGRAQQILEKYERIDPMEHEELKSLVTTLTFKNKEITQELVNLRDQLETKIDESEQKVAKLTAEITALAAERDRIVGENQKLANDTQEKVGKEELVGIQGKLDAALARNKDVVSQANEKLKAKAAQVKELKQNITALQNEKDALESRLVTELLEQKNTLSQQKDQELEKINKEWETKAEDLRKQLKSAAIPTKTPETTVVEETTPKRPREVEIEPEENSKRVKVDEQLPEAVADNTENVEEDQGDLVMDDNDEYEDIPEDEDEQEPEDANGDAQMDATTPAAEDIVPETGDSVETNSVEDLATPQAEEVAAPYEEINENVEVKQPEVAAIPPIVPLGTSTPLFSQTLQSAFGAPGSVPKPVIDTAFPNPVSKPPQVVESLIPAKQDPIANSATTPAPEPVVLQTPSSPVKAPSSPTKIGTPQVVVIQRTSSIPSATTATQPPITATPEKSTPSTPAAVPAITPSNKLPEISQPEKTTPTFTKAVSTPVSIKAPTTVQVAKSEAAPTAKVESKTPQQSPVKQNTLTLSAMEKKKKALLLQEKLKAEKAKTATPTSSEQGAKPKIVRTVPIGTVRGKGSIKVRGSRPGSGRGRGQPPT
ncbi:hypothetical protein HDV01_006732 [Terramyces sp. JEL0728]|nr:hypothetical protein HDV01_006732 [Terramyces sp. JEL0728]